MLILATFGPFIYLYLQQKTEERILQEEKRIQGLLMRVSYGMNSIHDLKRLLKLIVYVPRKTLKLNNAAIYLLDRETDEYILRAPSDEAEKIQAVGAKEPFLEELTKKKSLLVHEEIKIRLNMERDNPLLEGIIFRMRELSAAVILPIMTNNQLRGFLILGERKNGGMYSGDLLNALTVLANQAALAIENCHYLEAETKRMEEDGVRERLVSLDHMASSMAHEIDNPNTVILNQADLIVESLDRDLRIAMPEEIKKDIIGGLRFIQESSRRVSEMIRAILEYSRMGTGQLAPIKIYDALESFAKLISPELKKARVEIRKDIEGDLPYFLGDKIQIEEILMNLTLNALHAVKYNKGEKTSDC